jgi:hypothetical protein
VDGDSGSEARRGGFLRAIASDYKTFASLIGLLVYGVVRVAYDAFYSRLGVFPEAVGLSETTILGRAVLYLALTLSIAAMFIGLWLVAVGASLGRSRRQTTVGHRRANAMRVRRLFTATLALPVAAVALVAAGGGLRGLLTSNHLAYYCFQRCKFSGLKPSEVDALSTLARNLHGKHPDYRFVDFGPEWLVVLPVILLVIAGALGLLLGNRLTAKWTWRGNAIAVLPLVLFVLLGVAALLGGLLAPHLVAAAGEASGRGSSFIDTHHSFVKWCVFALVFAAAVAGLLAVLQQLVGDEDPRRSPWLLAAFVVVLPLMLGFFEPAVPRFVEEEGAPTLVAAVALWLAVLLIVYRLWPHLRDHTVKPSAGLAVLLALIVALTLDLAWERGVNLAKQAAMGDQILARRFGLLSVRSNVVCLEPSVQGATLHLPVQPYVYLGETGGTLVLYDFVSDLAHEVPTAFPIRAPASGVVVSDAEYDPGNPHGIAWANWNCPSSS